MKRRQLFSLTMVLLLTVPAVAAWAATPMHANIVGSYKLVSRTEKDGTIKKAPEVVGLQSFSRTYRNFNVAWKDANGKTFSYSVVSKYTLTDTSYTETKLYSIMNDEIGGGGLKYDFESKTVTVPVKFENGKVSFKLPFDPVTIEFQGNKGTALGDAGFTDAWFKVR